MANPSTDGLAFVSRETLSDRVYEQLRTAILSGLIGDETELNQVELAERFGVSRVPVREALMRLEAERLVSANSFQRYRVATLSREQVIELTEIREEIEVLALRSALVAARAKKLDLKGLRTAASRLSPKDDVSQWIEADRAFHRLLHGGDTMAARLVDDIRVRIHRYVRGAIAGEARRAEAMREHKAILDAIEAQDPARAESLLRKHIAATRSLLARRLGEATTMDEERRPR
jgi:DNA-binding GntR family transcriptional regulator